MNQTPNRSTGFLVLLIPILFIFFFFLPFGDSFAGGFYLTFLFQLVFVAVIISIIVGAVRKNRLTPQNFARNYRPVSQNSIKGQINPMFFPVIGIVILVFLFLGIASENFFFLIFPIIFTFIMVFAFAIHASRTGMANVTKNPDIYQDPFAIQRNKAFTDKNDQAAFTIDSKSRYADKADQSTSNDVNKSRYADKAEQSTSNYIEKSRYADKAEQSAFSVNKTSEATQKADHRAMTFDKSLTDFVRKDQNAYNATRSSEERKGDAVRNAGYYGMRKVGPNNSCLSCGKPVGNEDIYCKNCGKALF